MRRPPIRRVRLVTSAIVVDAISLKSEFPTVRVEPAHAACVDDVVIDAAAWLGATSFRHFDEAVENGVGDALIVRGDAHVVRVAWETLTRYQRFVDRRNVYSDCAAFDRVREAHLSWHDGHGQRTRADLDHALDAWQWLLRLRGDASLVAQLGALFHRAQPLEDEVPTLTAAGFAPSVAPAVLDVVARRQRRAPGDDVALLCDAEALSFLSLASPAYLDYFGAAQTRRMIGYTLRRLSGVARAKLAFIRLRPDIRELLREAAAA